MYDTDEIFDRNPRPDHRHAGAVKDFLRAEPRRIYMNVEIATPDSRMYWEESSKPPCGTACCVAGASVLVAFPDWIARNAAAGLKPFSGVMMKSRVLFGFTDDESSRLFYFHVMPELGLRDTYRQERVRYRSARECRDHVEMTEAACAAIDRAMLIAQERYDRLSRPPAREEE